MTQYCRYCNNMVCGDANYCTVKEKTFSDSYLKHTNTCMHFEFNPLDALGLVDEYKPRHTQKKEGKYLWMLVSDDDYELPLIVCDSIEELSKACGKEINTIRSAINHAEKRGSKSRYKRVKL